MKRFLIITVLLLCCMTGCSDDGTMHRANSSVTVEENGLVVTQHYDGSQDLIQRIEYNQDTKITIVYNYEWVNGPGFRRVCVGCTIVTIDANGNIIDSTEE